MSARGLDFPYGTLVVNPVGSFAVGPVYEVGADALLISSDRRLFQATG